MALFEQFSSAFPFVRCKTLSSYCRTFHLLLLLSRLIGERWRWQGGGRRGWKSHSKLHENGKKLQISCKSSSYWNSFYTTFSPLLGVPLCITEENWKSFCRRVGHEKSLQSSNRFFLSRPSSELSTSKEAKEIAPLALLLKSSGLDSTNLRMLLIISPWLLEARRIFPAFRVKSSRISHEPFIR